MNKGADKDNFLKLIHVGDLSYDSESDCHVFFCSFQPWLFSKNSPSGLPIVTHPISVDLAGSLICGSLWSDSLELSKFKFQGNFESQIFELNTDEISIVLLKDVLSPAVFTPESFWLEKGNTHVICINFYENIIIISYFELLRVLFYQASSQLTKFFFSLLSLDSLCRPIIFPKEENSWYGAFYVSSIKLTSSEARVLGGLLFDQALKNIFDLSQTYWLFPNHIGLLKKETNHLKKLAGKFNISILFNATGRSFSHKGNKYFWVDSMEMLSSPYSFDEVLFHPLQSSARSLSNNNDLPRCSETLNTRKLSNKLPKLYKCSDYKNKINKNKHVSTYLSEEAIKRKQLSNFPFPLVTCGLPWATTPVRTEKIYWLDSFLEKEVTQINNNLSKNHATYTNHLLDILTAFEKQNYSVKRLTLNNQNNFFGNEVSVFPVNRRPPSPINLIINNIDICTVASVELNYGMIFLIQPYPKNNPELIIFCLKQNLSTPNDLEWNNLFDIINPIYNSIEFYKFFRSVRKLNWNKAPTNSALLAIALPPNILTQEFCISFSNHVFSKLIKRLQFYTATALKYPDGMNYEQQRKVLLLSRRPCSAPDFLWTTKIFNYWSKYILK